MRLTAYPFSGGLIAQNSFNDSRPGATIKAYTHWIKNYLTHGFWRFESFARHTSFGVTA